VFTNWTNTYLQHRMTSISNLETDFKDGLHLIALLEIISSKTLPPYNKKPRIKAQCLENLNNCIHFLTEEGIKLVNIAGEDIYDCNLKLILGLVWTIILRYQIQVEGGKSAKNELLEWVRSKIPEYHINNFNESWTDGRAICALAEAVEHGTFNLPAEFTNDPLTDARMGISRAEEKLKIPAILLAEDMVLNPDDLANMTYISYYRDYEMNRSKRMEDEERLKLPVANNCVAYGPGLEGGEAMIPTHFFVETRNYKNQPIPIDHNPYNVIIQSPHGNEVFEISPVEEEEGKFIVDYTPTVNGNHKITVTLQDKNINRSPFSVMIGPAKPDPSKCRVWGPGVTDGEAAEKEFYIEPRNKSGEKINIPNLPLNAIISGPFGDVPVDLTFNDDEGIYVAKYNPIDPGQYHIEVNLQEIPLDKSPFTVNIDRPSNESDPTKTFAEGPGLEPGNKNTNPCSFTIHSVDKFGQPRKQGGDLFDVFIEDPNFDLIEPSIKDNEDGTYSVTYQPTAPGEYNIDVVQRNKHNPLFYDHISNSPINVKIEAGTNADKSIAFGPGLEDNVSDTLPTHFKIQAKDSNGDDVKEGGDDFAVLIDGPNGKIAPKIHDNGDGTYDVEYKPEDAGGHNISVLLDGMPIKDAPFFVNVKPGADFSRSFVENFTFLIRTKDKRGENMSEGKQNVTVAIKDPNGENVQNELRDIGDGTYLVIYSMPEDYSPGEYLISCKIDGKEIKGSPWKQVLN